MSGIKEGSQIKEAPIDKWSLKEKLCLASAVVRIGDQNWMSVSNTLQLFAEPNRPTDWFSPANCIKNYSSLLQIYENNKLSNSLSDSEILVETPAETILKKLTEERKAELQEIMKKEREEYLQLEDEIHLIQSGAATDSMIEAMCLQIEQEEKQKELDAIAHKQWLKQREERKLEMEKDINKVIAKKSTMYNENDVDDRKPEEISHIDVNCDIDPPGFVEKSTFTQELSENFYDDMSLKDMQKIYEKRELDRNKDETIDNILAAGIDLKENENLEETSFETDSQDSDTKSDSSEQKLNESTVQSKSPCTHRRSSTALNESISYSQASKNDNRDYCKWKKSIMLVYERLCAHKYSSLFSKPITKKEEPDYHRIVYRPMDLQTIRKNIENGNINNNDEFRRDVFLMFANALMYNKKDRLVYKMAQEMQRECVKEMDMLLEAQKEIEVPDIQETCTFESGPKSKKQDDILSKKQQED